MLTFGDTLEMKHHMILKIDTNKWESGSSIEFQPLITSVNQEECGSASPEEEAYNYAPWFPMAVKEVL